MKFLRQLPHQIDAEGMEFKQVESPGDDYLGVLDRTWPFHKSTYVQFERWLRDRGEDANADEAFRRRSKRDLKEGNTSASNRILQSLFLRPIGFGTRTYRLLLWYFLPVFVISCLLFWFPQSVQHREPTNGVRAAVAPADWQGLKPGLLATQTTVPMLSLAYDLGVVPSDQPILGTVDDKSWPAPIRFLRRRRPISSMPASSRS